MLKQVSPPTDHLATPEEVTHALKVSTPSATIGFALFSLACYLTFRIFESIAAPSRLMLWASMTSCILFVWLLLTLGLLFRRPSKSELISIWAPAAKLVLLGSDLIVVASIWLLLPDASETLVMTMMVLYICHSPTQILCSPENTAINKFGIVSVLGSAIGFLALKGGNNHLLVAGFMLCFGVVLYLVSGVIRKTMQDAVAARLASEAAAKELELALKTVGEERDAKTRFIAAASHDLGQPLQAANLFFDQAMRASDESSRTRAALGVQKAFAAAEQLLSHMLNHLRLEADAVVPHRSRIDMAQCFSRLRAQYLPLAMQEEIELRIAKCRCTLYLDPALLDRAIGNLINNAIVHSGAKTVLMGCRVQGTKTRVYVIDNGVGIGSTDAKHIFQDFYRGSDSRAQIKSGFGLGLSSVRRIALLMGGHAALDPRWIRGAAFYLEFSGGRAGDVQSAGRSV